MRCLLIEAMKDEKRRGLLTEHEINEKYRNSFTYQTTRSVVQELNSTSVIDFSFLNGSDTLKMVCDSVKRSSHQIQAT